MRGSVPVVRHGQFVYHQSMDADCPAETAASRLAAAIGEPARARILYRLLDGHARTSTELALIAEVSPSTASVHLAHLKEAGVVRVMAQGKHRYYSLQGTQIAAALEALMVAAVGGESRFVPRTPQRLRAARTCYDHMAGTVGVAIHDRLKELGWLTDAYEVSMSGERALAELGVDVAAARSLRRRFAYGCVDWSERRPHIGGALGAALLHAVVRHKWVLQELDSRALRVTRTGYRALQSRLGLRLAPA
jgi:DNA-binding transcriptional ArsR family regulator